MAKVTWLGDVDPSAQIIEQYGHTFIKGEPVEVGENDPYLGKFRRMTGVFSLDDNAKPIESKEPDPVDTEEGTERAAIKAALDARRIEYDGRAKTDALRAKLAASEA